MGGSERQQQIANADVIFASQSTPKVEANKPAVRTVMAAGGRDVVFGSVDPEIFAVELEAAPADVVAFSKTETLRQELLFDPNRETLLFAFDVTTAIAESPADFAAGNGQELKRMLRQLKLPDDQETEGYWQQILDTLNTEQLRMLRLCTKGAFVIEWQIGFALNSQSGTYVNRGVLVLQASFTALSEDVVFQAFALSESLQQMQAKGERPTPRDLAEGVKAFAIGPRLPFVKLIPEYGQPDQLLAYNRDYPEEQYQLTAEQFLTLVRDCAMTPQMVLQLLAGSGENLEGSSPLAKPTVKLTPVS